MIKQQFIFKKDNKQSWESIKSNLIQKVNELIGVADKDFQINIGPYKEKRSCQQLKGYWVLVKAIQEWVLERGNLYLKDDLGRLYSVNNAETLSDWIKIQAGHCEKRVIAALYYKDKFEIGGTTPDYINIPKSISNNSDCTKEDMKKIIDWVLNFAVEFNITNCYIQDKELDNLLGFYDRN